MSEQVLRVLNKILGKYEKVTGIKAVGSEDLPLKQTLDGKLVVDPSVVYVTLQPHFLEKRTTDPSPEVARIYFNTVENRPKVYVEQ